ELQAEQLVIRRGWFGLQGVDSRPADATFRKRLGQRELIDNSPARAVDHERIGFQEGKLFGTDQAPRLRRERAKHGQYVTPSKDSEEWDATRPRNGRAFPFRDKDAHPEPAANPGYRPAQRAEADDPESAAPQRATHWLREHRGLGKRRPHPRSNRRVISKQVSPKREGEGENVLRNGPAPPADVAHVHP